MLAALAAGEGGLRAWDRLPRFHRRPPGLQLSMRVPPGTMRGVPPATEYRTSSLGLRGAEPPERPGTLRVLAVGGSTTECLYLDEEQAWPAQVEARWNASRPQAALWVGNAGISGYSTRHHRELLLEDPLVAEVDEVWFLVGINDLRHAVSGHDRQVSAALEARRRAPAWRHLYLWRLAERALGSRSPEEAVIDLEGRDGAAYPVRRRLRRERPHQEALPALEGALVAYAARLRELVGLCRVRGATPRLMTQPVLWRPDLSPQDEAQLWMGIRADGTYASAAALAEGMARYDDATRRIAGELEVDLVDLARRVTAPAAFYDDCHLTVAGSREVAEAVLEHLRGSPPRPRKR